jgi:hypothetical protein
MSAERALQEAVYLALTNDAPYMALIPGGLHDDEAPEGAAYPFTVLGEATEVESRSHGDSEDGYELTLTLHDWGSYEGKRELQLIREARNDAIHNVTLSVTGWSSTRFLYEFGAILPEYDEKLGGWVRHQITRYRVNVGSP